MHGEDADLALLHVVSDDLRQAGQRPRRDIFQDERLVRRADLLDLVDQAGGDVFAIPIGDHGDALVRLNVEADPDGVARAGSQFLVESSDHLYKFYSPAAVSATMY